MRKIKITLLMLLFAVPVLCLAMSSPVPVLQGIANKMIAELEQNKRQLKSNPGIIHRIVNKVLMPHVAVNRMAGSVVGRRYWTSATAGQRKEFIKEFKYLVINTYSNALASYDDDKVKFYPMRSEVTSRAVRVKSTLIRKSGQRIAINYNVIYQAAQWKIYDFSIEGVSIVNNYRSQFAGTLASGGMNALLEKLRKFNRGGRA